MKTQNDKLVFSKSSIVELQNAELAGVNGGSTFISDFINYVAQTILTQISPATSMQGMEASQVDDSGPMGN